MSWSSRSLADAPKGGEGRITEDGRAVCDQGRRPILADGAAALAAPRHPAQRLELLGSMHKVAKTFAKLYFNLKTVTFILNN